MLNAAPSKGTQPQAKVKAERRKARDFESVKHPTQPSAHQAQHTAQAQTQRRGTAHIQVSPTTASQANREQPKGFTNTLGKNRRSDELMSTMVSCTTADTTADATAAKHKQKHSRRKAKLPIN
jgi:tartrate dehydratase beta subunit/fumarate hydratase class I family protein